MLLIRSETVFVGAKKGDIFKEVGHDKKCQLIGNLFRGIKQQLAAEETGVFDIEDCAARNLRMTDGDFI